MSDPYVKWAPVNVGACSATWYVGPEVWSGGATGTAPTFGWGGVIASNPSDTLVGAWDFLVPGPLKDTLTQPFAADDAYTANVMQKWAEAGGEISIMGFTQNGAEAVYGAAARPFYIGGLLGPAQMGFFINYDTDAYPSLPTPIRWVVKFSVSHSVTR